jgi:hypothetical protein
MSAPLVSIILPTYNGAAYLSESLESCLSQTYPNLEIVVVDDASTDETPAIIGRFVERDARVRSVRHATNGRLPTALNTGFAAAQGEYLTWTSDDNRYAPTAIAEMAAVLDARPEVGFVYSDYELIDGEGQLLSTVQVTPAIELVTAILHTIPSFLYRRRVYAQVGPYRPALELAEDYDFWLRVLAMRQPMVPLHQTLYQYRQHGGSLTSTRRAAMFAAAERALAEALPRMPWLTRQQRAAGYLHLVSLRVWQGRSRSASTGRYLATATALDLPTTLRKIGDFTHRHAVAQK